MSSKRLKLSDVTYNENIIPTAPTLPTTPPLSLNTPLSVTPIKDLLLQMLDWLYEFVARYELPLRSEQQPLRLKIRYGLSLLFDAYRNHLDELSQDLCLVKLLQVSRVARMAGLSNFILLTESLYTEESLSKVASDDFFNSEYKHDYTFLTEKRARLVDFKDFAGLAWKPKGTPQANTQADQLNC